VPAGRLRRAIAPQRSCVHSVDCDSEGDESSPEPAPVAPARADRASGEHRCCDKKLPIPNSSDIEAFRDFEPGKQYPVRSAPRPPIPATLARAMTSAQYQSVGSQPQHSKLVKPAPKVRKNHFTYNRSKCDGHSACAVMNPVTICGRVGCKGYDVAEPGDDCLITELREPGVKSRILELAEADEILIPTCSGAYIPARIAFRQEKLEWARDRL
jgi:hypothetical protein